MNLNAYCTSCTDAQRDRCSCGDVAAQTAPLIEQAYRETAHPADLVRRIHELADEIARLKEIIALQADLLFRSTAGRYGALLDAE